MAASEGGDGKLESLLTWAAEIGITDSPPPHAMTAAASVVGGGSHSCLGRSLVVSLFPGAGGRGLAAARDLRKGEMVLSVPRAALLTRDSVLRDEKMAAFVRRHLGLSPNQLLIVCLLAEVGKGKDSWWHPYLVELPRSYDTLSSFTSFEIEALQVEDAMWASQKAVTKAKSEWKGSIGLMQEIGLKRILLSFKSWLWASATISSRTLHIPWDTAGCLCPIGDLFNYAAPEEEYSSDSRPSKADGNSVTGKFDDYSQSLTDGGYDSDHTSYCFYARKAYAKGEQVLLSYGTYTNLDLLEHYGFIMDSNPNDKAFTRLDADIYAVGSWPREALYIQPNGHPSFALLAVLRLREAPASQRKAIGFKALSGSPLSVGNETLVLEWLASHCRMALDEMPTGIEGDNPCSASSTKHGEATSACIRRGTERCC